jgi:hypothetical protein
MTNFKWYRRLLGGKWQLIGYGMFHTQMMWTRPADHKCVYKEEDWG